MIHVCFGLYDKTGRYSKFTGTTMLSIFDNTSFKVTVHILHDNTLTQDNRDKFIYLAGRYNQRVKFYNVEELCKDKIAEFWQIIPSIETSWSTIGTFFKFFIPQLLPNEINKCIYLDSDMVVNLDISELWRVKLDDKPLAAVPEILASPQQHISYSQGIIKAGFVEFEDYFNAGLLVMNLNYLRKNESFIMSGVKWRGEHPQCYCFDQDIWNYCFSKNYVRLPRQFNIFVRDARVRKENYILRAVYHYADSNNGKGFGLNTNEPFNRLWMDYFLKTPWFDSSTIGRLYENFRCIHVDLKQSTIKLSAEMSGKTRVFLTLPDWIDIITKNFSLRDDEKIIVIKSEDTLSMLIKLMAASCDKKIFFIMVANFPFQSLMEAGFEQGKDFVNVLELLPNARSINMDSYRLIKNM